MALIPTDLGDGIATMEPTDVEADAIASFAGAWDDYFQGGSVSGVPVGSSTAAAKSAMQSAMVGMSASGAGAASIASGVTAYWGGIAPAVVALWTVPGFTTTPPGVPPTTLGALAPAITAVFEANTSGDLPLEAAAQSLASALHTSGGLGGLVTLVPVAPPNSPVPTPIL